MKKIFYPLTKAGRRSKQQAKESKLVDRLRFAQHELLYREKAIESGVTGVGNDANESITISLTSFGPRVETVYLAIESLMQQSLRADRIVLCLAKDEFSEANLPATLKSQRKRGLEILFCDEDIGPYTKFFFTLQEYPQDLIITVDDDHIYPVDTVDLLYRAYLKEPEVIHCNRGHQIVLNAQGKLQPYKQWNWDHSSSEASLKIFPTGVGGVLYFPGSLDEAVLDKETFLKLAPNSDDVWLKAMSLKNSVKCKQVQSIGSFMQKAIQIPGSQVVSLKRANKGNLNGNDLALTKVFDAYNLYGKIKGD